jgi:hypothetical protein
MVPTHSVGSLFVILSSLYSLGERWRAEAKLLRARGAVDAADAADGYARELDAGLRDLENEPLTLQQAALESGYTYSTLQQYVAKGIIPNAGKIGRPRVRRRDLPCSGVRAAGPDIADRVLLRRL